MVPAVGQKLGMLSRDFLTGDDREDRDCTTIGETQLTVRAAEVINLSLLESFQMAAPCGELSSQHMRGENRNEKNFAPHDG